MYGELVNMTWNSFEWLNYVSSAQKPFGKILCKREGKP